MVSIQHPDLYDVAAVDHTVIRTPRLVTTCLAAVPSAVILLKDWPAFPASSPGTIKFRCLMRRRATVKALSCQVPMEMPSQGEHAGTGICRSTQGSSAPEYQSSRIAAQSADHLNSSCIHTRPCLPHNCEMEDSEEDAVAGL